MSKMTTIEMIERIINVGALREAAQAFAGSRPFPHLICDGFFVADVAARLADEFPDHWAECWHEYNNVIEVKRVQNDWNRFGEMTYRVFNLLNSAPMTALLEDTLGIGPLFADPGLNGGGWHSHARGGKLNVHLDYSLHPKLALQRKLNIIVYLNPRWRMEWGGELGLWGPSDSPKRPGTLTHLIEPRFNRAVMFDTTGQSWHGLPEPVRCPAGEARQSIAVYYLTTPAEDVDPRGKALFAPYQDQADNPEVLALIEERAAVATAASSYRQKK